MIALQRFLLLTLLTLFLLGLAAHSLPVSICGCGTLPDATDFSNVDICLICQLQAGVRLPILSTSSFLNGVFAISHQPVVNPLEHVRAVLHPPIA